MEKPVKLLSELEEFLEVEPEINEDYFVMNNTKGYFCFKNLDTKPPTTNIDLNSETRKWFMVYLRKFGSKEPSVYGELAVASSKLIGLKIAKMFLNDKKVLKYDFFYFSSIFYFYLQYLLWGAFQRPA